MLKIEFNDAMHKWDDYVPYIKLAYNSKISPLRGSTPLPPMYRRALYKFLTLSRLPLFGDELLSLPCIEEPSAGLVL